MLFQSAGNLFQNLASGKRKISGKIPQKRKLPSKVNQRLDGDKDSQPRLPNGSCATEQQENERRLAEKVHKEKLQKEKEEEARKEKERLQREKQEKEQLEKQRLEKERQELEKIEKESMTR